MSDGLRIFYIREERGNPVIREIDRDIIAAARARGVTVSELELSELEAKMAGMPRQALQEELVAAIKRFDPHFAMGYNFTGVMPTSDDSHVLEKLKIPYFGMFYDNPLYFTNAFERCRRRRDLIYIFGIDPETFGPLKRLGFNQVHYLPIATSLRPPDENARRPTLPAPILFVGGIKTFTPISELEDRYPEERRLFFKETAKASLEENVSVQQEILQRFFRARPQADKAFFRMENLEFQKFWFDLDVRLTPHQRVQTVNALSDLGVLVIGGKEWLSAPIAKNVTLRPPVRYRDELPGFYRAAKVTVNRSPLNLQNALQQRVLDVAAAGGFPLTEYRPVLERHFKIGRQLAVYHDLNELREKVTFFLTHEDKRLKFAENLRREVLANHTWERRIEEFLAFLQRGLR